MGSVRGVGREGQYRLDRWGVMEDDPLDRLYDELIYGAEPVINDD